MRDQRGYQDAAFTDPAWLLEQQLRAEWEAEEWRRLRLMAAASVAPNPAAPFGVLPAQAPAPEAKPLDFHKSGSTILKALVRFMLAAFGGYIAFIAAIDSQAGEFEGWLATGAGFVITLALTAFGPGRRIVYFLAEAARWIIIIALVLGVFWLIVHTSA